MTPPWHLPRRPQRRVCVLADALSSQSPSYLSIGLSAWAVCGDTIARGCYSHSFLRDPNFLDPTNPRVFRKDVVAGFPYNTRRRLDAHGSWSLLDIAGRRDTHRCHWYRDAASNVILLRRRRLLLHLSPQMDVFISWISSALCLFP